MSTNSLASRLTATWRRLPLAGSALPRSSHNLYLSPDGAHLKLFGGEIQPRQPVDAVVHVLAPLPGSGSDSASSASSPASELKWSSSEQKQPSASQPAPRVGASSCKGAQGEWYVWSGRGGKDMAPLPFSDGSGGEAVEDLWKLHPGSDAASPSWEAVKTKGQRPETRSYATMAYASRFDTLYLHAGCPAKGRLGTLHALNLASKEWTQCKDAPREGRGGTVLAAVKIPSQDSAERKKQKEVLMRWGGFCG